MFKRKDEDIDLLTEAGGNMTTDTTEKNEPKMTTTPAASPAETPSTAPATAVTPAATPATPAAPTTPTAGYAAPTTPNDSSRMARPASFRPGGEAARPAAGGRPGTDYRPANPAAAMGGTGMPSTDKAKSSGRRVLTVGHDILLKGEIATCDRLVIEGAVDATLNEVHTVEIAETGSFKGAAEIEDAEISGEFDGELTVRGRLVIYSTGKVRGKITYGEIEIERGGEMTGTIKSFKSDGSSSKKDNKAAKTDKEKEKEKVAA